MARLHSAAHLVGGQGVAGVVTQYCTAHQPAGVDHCGCRLERHPSWGAGTLQWTPVACQNIAGSSECQCAKVDPISLCGRSCKLVQCSEPKGCVRMY